MLEVTFNKVEENKLSNQPQDERKEEKIMDKEENENRIEKIKNLSLEEACEIMPLSKILEYIESSKEEKLIEGGVVDIRENVKPIEELTIKEPSKQKYYNKTQEEKILYDRMSKDGIYIVGLLKDEKLKESWMKIYSGNILTETEIEEILYNLSRTNNDDELKMNVANRRLKQQISKHQGYRYGKIYKIYSYKTEKIYIGSTQYSIWKRFKEHRKNYKKDGCITSKEIFKIDESPHIEILEIVKFKDENELLFRERDYILENIEICVNKCMPIRKNRGESIYVKYNKNVINIKK